MQLLLVLDNGVFNYTRITLCTFKIEYLQLGYKSIEESCHTLHYFVFSHRCWSNLRYIVISQIYIDLVKQYNQMAFNSTSISLYKISERKTVLRTYIYRLIYRRYLFVFTQIDIIIHYIFYILIKYKVMWLMHKYILS